MGQQRILKRRINIMPEDSENNENSSEDNENVKNKADDYTAYWSDKTIKNDQVYEQSSDRPEFHCYISFQKEGTETEAEHYEGQDDNNNSNDSSSTNNDSDSSNDSTSS